MEFLYKKIFATANAIESLFGQPSVGTDMYLTPPGSLGLASQYGDPCVFVLPSDIVCFGPLRIAVSLTVKRRIC